MKSSAIPTGTGFTMKSWQQKRRGLILFAWLSCANLLPLAQAETPPDTSKNRVDELVSLTVQQSSAWGEMLDRGDYEAALALNAGTEKKLNEALRQLETSPAEGTNTPAQSHPTNIARLKYALSLIYFQQSGSYSRIGAQYQLSKCPLITSRF